jgi:hypothetical protein
VRLTCDQKAAALAQKPKGASLVRCPGMQWGVVWFDETQPRRERWRSQLLCKVVPSATGTVLSFAGLALVHPSPWDVWWSGNEFGAATRRHVVELLHAEASL